jgi:hypothetical protein
LFVHLICSTLSLLCFSFPIYNPSVLFLFIIKPEKGSCVIPEKYKKEIESKCFKFIWNEKPDKVRRNTLIGDFEKDGLKMIDIESFFHNYVHIKNKPFFPKYI